VKKQARSSFEKLYQELDLPDTAAPLRQDGIEE
jgi:hypothetical protein